MPAANHTANHAATHAARHGIRMPERGRLLRARGGAPARLPTPEIHFGVALWPYDLLLRFAWDLPENEHVWPDDWFDDVFESAAVRLRFTAPKLMLAIAALQPPLEALKDAALADELTHEQVEQVPLQIDLALGYLAQMLDDLAAVIPHCYGVEGRALSEARSGIAALAASPVADLDPELAALLAPDGGLEPAAAAFARPHPLVGGGSGSPPAHSRDIYAIVNAPGFDSALPKAAARALRESAAATIEAADRIDAGLPLLCGWLDALLEHLIGAVCARAEDGEDLRERWSEANWSRLQVLSFADTSAALALTRALPAIAEGPILPGTED